MPPTIALLICSLFTLIIFRWGGEKSRGVSRSLWIPTIWILYCATRPVGEWINPDSSADLSVADGSSVDRNLLCIFIAIGWFILRSRPINWSKVFRDNRWLVILCAFMAISILWSDYTFVSFKRWIRFCATPMMALIVLTEPYPERAMEAILRRTAYLCIPFSLLLIKYFPNLGVQYDIWTGERMWVGVTTQKNGLGRLCLISAFFLVWQIIKAWPHRKNISTKWKMRADVMVLGLTLLLLRGPGGEYSATSIVALVFAVFMYCLLLFMKKHYLNMASAILVISIATAVFLGILIPIVGGSGASGFLDLIGRDVTFTGRTYIWQAILPVAMRSAICGVGYGSFWINPPISYQLTLMVNEAHNGYLDVFVEIGFVGMVLFLIFLMSSCRQAQKALPSNFEWSAFVLCFLFIIVVHNITESSFLRPTNHMGAVLFFLAMSVPYMRRSELLSTNRVYFPDSLDSSVGRMKTQLNIS